MTRMATPSRSTSPYGGLLCAVGLVAGGLVNLAGVAAAGQGLGLWIYWVLMTVSVMVGVTAWLSKRAHWFGAGLTVGCVVMFAVLLVLALATLS